MVRNIKKLQHWHKTLTAIIFDLLMAMSSFYLALAIRLGSWTPQPIKEDYFPQLLLIVAITQSLTFYLNGLYKGVWRYSSTNDLLRVIRATTLSVLFSFLAVFLYTRLDQIPRSLFFIDWLLLVVALGGGRLIYRMLKDHYQFKNKSSASLKRVLIIGAGAGGEQLFREIRKGTHLGLKVIGFLDDNPSFKLKTLHGVTILGSTQEARVIVRAHNINTAFIAIPSATSNKIKRIFDILKPLEIEIKILPKMSDILGGRIEFSNLRNLKIEDLLGREEVTLDMRAIGEMLTDRRVLVTGAGGSIGSELCSQLAMFNPKTLTAIDVSEYNTYTLDQKLRRTFPELVLRAIVGDVRDQTFIDKIFQDEKPEVVLHAAAYKHVPLMEFNPFESVRTNVVGTKVVCQACIRHEVDRFVLISTDKAVNPTNVMGTTKRIAEMVVQELKSQNSNTKLMTVRFGNVLGSSGSVIPLFQKQIENGGPVTVTHPEITRYFMSIPEATKLVLQAGAMGSGGELFVLDMGEPVKIVDLAREMISLAGLEEGIDLEIEYSGLRPGEKLYEEPLMEIEECLPTSHPKVRTSRARPVHSCFSAKLSRLLELDINQSREQFILAMKEIVPEYTPFGLADTSVDTAPESSDKKEILHH